MNTTFAVAGARYDALATGELGGVDGVSSTCCDELLDEEKGSLGLRHRGYKSAVRFRPAAHGPTKDQKTQAKQGQRSGSGNGIGDGLDNMRSVEAIQIVASGSGETDSQS